MESKKELNALLGTAIAFERLDIIFIILEEGNRDSPDVVFVLSKIISNSGKINLFKPIFERYISLLADIEVNQIINTASFNNRFDIVKYILGKKQEIMTQFSIGYSFKYACYFNQFYLIKYVLNNYLHKLSFGDIENGLRELRIYKDKRTLRLLAFYKDIKQNDIIVNKYKNTLILS